MIPAISVVDTGMARLIGAVQEVAKAHGELTVVVSHAQIVNHGAEYAAAGRGAGPDGGVSLVGWAGQSAAAEWPAAPGDPRRRFEAPAAPALLRLAAPERRCSRDAA